MANRTFSVENSADLVAERVKRGEPGRYGDVLASLISHLHRFVCETRPSVAEWRKAIGFLTEVGHATDEKRQEWVLASDLFGITALVEEINTKRPKLATPNTVRGPFYRPDAPPVVNGGNISLDGKGEPLDVAGRIVDLDRQPVAGATVETWQANAQGFYENQEPDTQPEFNLRGVLTSDCDGRFHYSTVRPAGYSTPSDGPVGRLLSGLGCPLRRPAHLHFIIRAKGFETISTHVFDGNDPFLAEDAIFGVKPELVGKIQRNGDRWALDFTFVMVRAKRERNAA